MAMNHRMTDAGNFYCLVFNHPNQRYMRSIYPIISERRQVAMRAKCNELNKGRFPPDIARTITELWRNMTITPAIAGTLSMEIDTE